jgi:hypothetical protein
MKNKELIIDTVGVALTILIVVVCSLVVSGCTSNKHEQMYHLLYKEPSTAYKSPTIKDYKDDDDMCSS